jgi:hypothetical protein
MSTEGAHPASVSTEDRARWEERIRRRNAIRLYTAIAFGLAVIVAVLGFIAYEIVDIVTDIYGPEAWPSGVSLVVLIAWSAKMMWRYCTQRGDEDDSS